MTKFIKFSGLLLICFFLGKNMYAQNALQQKFHKAIEFAYGIEKFDLQEISVSEETAKKLPSEINHQNLFKVNKGGKLVGYTYLGEAASKKRIFDYAIFFTPTWTIKKSKVLIYREDFGRQIGTQRWLSQFEGMSPTDQAVYGKEIDGISGATISATSMTRAVNKVLKSVAILQEEEVL